MTFTLDKQLAHNHKNMKNKNKKKEFQNLHKIYGWRYKDKTKQIISNQNPSEDGL